MNTKPGTLWIIATPIGTLGDLGPRAADVLDRVAAIYAEDTRRTRKLLNHLDIGSRGRLHSLHEHNEASRIDTVLEVLASGRDAALVSDAGTPALSDPGFTLVRALRERDVPIASVPGPSAFTAALAASGQPPLPALLVGFLPPRASARRTRIAECDEVDATLVIFLSPHRLARELADLAEGLGPTRPATLIKEISKLNEKAFWGTLGDLTECPETEHPRGEYVIVVGPAPVKPPEPLDEPGLRRRYDAFLDAGLGRKKALRRLADESGLRRNEIYDLLFTDRAGNRDFEA